MFCNQCSRRLILSASGKYPKRCFDCKYQELQGLDRPREMVRKRDRYTCQECGKIWLQGQRRFDVHHLNGLCGRLSRTYDRIKDISGLITLCHKCHLNLDEVKRKMENKSSPRLNKHLSTLQYR